MPLVIEIVDAEVLGSTTTGMQERFDWGTGGGERAYGTFREEYPGKGKSFEMKIKSISKENI